MLFPLILAAVAAGAPCLSDDSLESRLSIWNGQAIRCPVKSPPNRKASPAEEAATKASFDRELFDGPTARWRFEHVRGGALVCGYVNSKNRLGAYVGWTPFIFNLKERTGTVYSDDAWLFRTLCFGDPVPPAGSSSPRR